MALGEDNVKNVITILLPSKFSYGIILRCLNSHHAMSGYSKNYDVNFIVTISSRKGYVN